MRFALWTADLALARAALAAKIDMVGPDLEIIGKEARQAGTDSLISRHPVEVLADMRAAGVGPALFARCNPPAHALGAEIERLLDEGVRHLMVPMLRTPDEIAAVTRQVAGRARVIAMIEHADALPHVDAIAAVDGVDALYVGTNDLGATLGMHSRFGAMLPDVLEPIAAAAARYQRSFAFFGLGRAGDASLPVPTELVFAEWARLNADFCLLARSFRASPATLAADIGDARAAIARSRYAPPGELDAAHREFVARCEAAERAAARPHS